MAFSSRDIPIPASSFAAWAWESTMIARIGSGSSITTPMSTSPIIQCCGQVSIFVLAPISGVVADAKSRKHILFATQIAPMLLSFLLAVLTLSGRVQVWHVFTVAALMGIVNAFDFPVRQAFVAELVPREDLISAVTLNSSMINSARTIGPGIGGLLVAGVGEGWCFLGNALSYVAVIIGLLMIKSTAAKKKTPQHFRAGVDLIISSPM